MNHTPLIFDRATHEARKYWRERLASISFAGPVALDHPRPRDGRRDYATLEQRLEREITARLQRLTAGNPFLAYTALVLALEICCARYSGTPDVTIISPATSERAAGNLLPISSTIDPESSFKQALLATKELLADAYRYDQYPFSRMLLDLPEERRPAALPIVASMVELDADALEPRPDLVVWFSTAPDATTVSLRFDRLLYDEPTIRHFFRSFAGLLQQGLSNMTLRIADLAPDDADVSAAAAPEPDAEAYVYRQVALQAAQHPESIAVVEGERCTSYQALEQAATELAAVLAALGPDVERPIGVLLDASTEMILGMYAVMKVGAAFAPIRPLATSHAVEELLRALGCECLLCRQEDLAHVRQLADAGAGIRYAITVDFSAPAAAYQFSTVALARDADAAPRGVARPAGAGDGADGARTACVLAGGHDAAVSVAAVSHAELAGLLQWLNQASAIGPRDRCLFSPSLGACEQLYDTFGMLIAGASVEIRNEAGLRDSSGLARRLLAAPITVWDLPTGLMQNILPELLALRADAEPAPGPRAILLSGEEQCAALADTLREQFPDARITGLYAPPALPLWTTAFDFGDGAADPGHAVVARPIPGFAHQIRNARGEVVPRHTTGAVHVRRLWAARSPAAGASAPDVRTGVRAERLDDARMRWLRGDDHGFVKYGCRVELTGLEAALCQHEQIRAAEVLAVDVGQEGDRQVVAFLLADAAHMSAEAARDFLVLACAVDLIPDRFILLDAFPLLADGAIDRAALVRGFVRSQEGSGDAGPIAADEVYVKLKQIWLESLQLAAIGDDESFFTAGGNSLMATLLIARIRDEFGVQLSVQSFFRKPTARAVAQLIAAEAQQGAPREEEADFQVVSREKYRIQLPAGAAERTRT